MATKIVQFEVDPGDTEAQWLAIDDKDVPLVNHKGSVDVDASIGAGPSCFGISPPNGM